MYCWTETEELEQIFHTGINNGRDKQDKEETNRQDRKDENQTNYISEEIVQKKDKNVYCVICEKDEDR